METINSSFIYNNEAIGASVLASYISMEEKLSLSKSMLILPFLLHEPTTKILKDKRIIIRSLEEFVIKYTSLIFDFNKRYLNYLPLSINSISILREINSIEIRNTCILNKQRLFTSKKTGKPLGQRYELISDAIPKLVTILNQEDSSLYSKLRIEL